MLVDLSTPCDAHRRQACWIQSICLLFYFKQSIAAFILGKIATYIANESRHPILKKDEASPLSDQSF